MLSVINLYTEDNNCRLERRLTEHVIESIQISIPDLIGGTDTIASGEFLDMVASRTNITGLERTIGTL